MSGKTVNSVRKWGGVKADDWRVELDQLQKKHDSIEAQISALEDQAPPRSISRRAPGYLERDSSR